MSRFLMIQCVEMWANMPNVMAAPPNIGGGALCSTPQRLADARY